MAAETLRQQISREVKRVLEETGMSAAAAAREMPGNPDAKLLYRWINGDVTAPLERLEEFALATKRTIHLSVGKAKEARPWWDGLREKIDAIAVAVDARVGETPAQRVARLAVEDTRTRQRRGGGVS